MDKSSLEITPQQYCIKLNRNDYDLSVVHQIINWIQARESVFNPQILMAEEEDINSRTTDIFADFDHLDDK